MLIRTDILANHEKSIHYRRCVFACRLHLSLCWLVWLAILCHWSYSIARLDMPYLLSLASSAMFGYFGGLVFGGPIHHAITYLYCVLAYKPLRNLPATHRTLSNVVQL